MSEWKTAMFFYEALQHLMDGKLIRRRSWEHNATLSRGSEGEIRFDVSDASGFDNFEMDSIPTEDIMATDWEVVGDAKTEKHV